MSKTFAKAASYPLCWPSGFPEHQRRQSSRFKTTLFSALENVQGALQALARDSGKKITDIVISSNYSLTDTKPKNPGVAVWFNWDGAESCIPVDVYDKVECNLQAIYHCLEADRTKLRHGGYNMVKAAYHRVALPAPDHRPSWREVLGYDGNDLSQAKKSYQRLTSKHHPDNGGNAEQFNRVCIAFEEAKRELGEVRE